ncbi:efflux RND transporter periplasmic adaptor subunit [Candidatus Magnetaquicoccus inordinatus]|uniref:efflux RND transporter periplasmic adaptor subunit n=1 Tax=Candidatus Magnetaquicoccus inordinatus TaxID=2496818 RepID=UPI00102CEC5E|nr:HlyD family efflux transporter periplasmic adaptor subunit [Candidatus Magnetaquicoccus inordinatus]
MNHPSAHIGPSQLVTLLGLLRKARELQDAVSLTFLMVNETKQLSPYRQAALWRSHAPGEGEVEALSGLALLEQQSPFVLWLQGVLAHLSRQSSKRGSLQLAQQPLPAQEEVLSNHPVSAMLPTMLAEEWSQWFPDYALWLPMYRSGPPEQARQQLGGIILARDFPWENGERQLLEELVAGYALLWQPLLQQRSLWTRGNEIFFSQPWGGARLLRMALLAGALLALLLPVRQSALAPAVVVAAQPVIVRAPLAGVIDRFHVAPNAMVTAGQLLFSLEDTQLRNQLETAKKELEVAAADYRQAVQKATRENQKMVQTTLQEKRWEQKNADVEYLTERLSRVDVRAVRAGVAIFSDSNDWIGRPVKVGERVLLLADPQQVELEIHLPVADAITLEPGAEIAFFLHIHPQDPLPAVLEYASYQAEVTAEALLAYRIKARFRDTRALPRIGLAGSARIYHQTVSLFTLLSRRPLAVARRWLGI